MKYGIFLFFKLLVLFSCATNATPLDASKLDDLKSLSFKNRSLKNILSHYQRTGYDLYFSDALVTNEMISYANLKSDEPILRLEKLLLIFGLDLSYDYDSGNDPGEVTYYIIEGVPYVMPETHSLDIPKPHVEEIIVTASTYHLSSVNNEHKTTLSAVDISNSLTPANDPIRILNTLPGVASAGLSAKTNIRGGNDDELLIIFDDIELIDPFHLKDFQSLISGINAGVIKSMDIYTGGYPVRYGGKMSGVMDIKPRDTLEEFHNAFSFNPFSTSFQTQGESQSTDVNWLVAARRGNLDDTLGAINPRIGSPRFHDFFGRIGWNFNDTTKLSAGYLLIQDDISLNQLDGDEGEFSTSLYISQYGWLKANIQHNARSNSRWIITNADVKNDRSGFINEPNNPDESVGSVNDNRDFEILRLDYLFRQSGEKRSAFEFGFRVEHSDAQYRYNASVLRGELATLIGTERDINISVNENPSGLAGFVFASYQYSPWKNLDVEGGLRYDTQHYYQDEEHQLSPRVAARFTLTDDLALKASTGRFFQSPRITELDVETGQSEFYAAQKSHHSIVGIEYTPISQFRLSLEAYTKHVQRPRPRNENLFNPYVLLPELSADRIRITPDKVEAEGVEVRLDYKYNPRIKTWLSFSTSEVSDQIDNREVRRRWNQTRAVRTGISYNNGPISLNSQIQWHKGWRYTQLPTVVDSLDVPIDYQRNNTPQPDFFSWDIRASYTWLRPSYSLEAYLEVFNLTNRDNVGALEIEISSQENGDGFLLEPNLETLLPIIPSIGFTIKF